jgi:hypothetical protein
LPNTRHSISWGRIRSEKVEHAPRFAKRVFEQSIVVVADNRWLRCLTLATTILPYCPLSTAIHATPMLAMWHRNWQLLRNQSDPAIPLGLDHNSEQVERGILSSWDHAMEVASMGRRSVDRLHENIVLEMAIT